MDLKKIFIVAGHGKSSSGKFDPGAVADDHTTPENGDKVTERYIILQVFEELKKILPSDKLVFVGGEGEEKSVSEKTKFINDYCKKHGLNKENSLGISVHANWASPTGEGAFAIYQSDDANEKKFAEVVGREVALAGRVSDRPEMKDTATRFGRLGIVRDTIPTFCLIELGYLNKNLPELKHNPKNFAFGIVRGLEEFSGEELASLEETVAYLLGEILSNAQDSWAIGDDEVKRLSAESGVDIRKIQRILGLPVSP